MKRSLGDKRRYLDQTAIDSVTREHGALTHSATSRVFDNTDFGYRRITVNRPLRLRFQLDADARERFLNTCPELFEAAGARRRYGDRAADGLEHGLGASAENIQDVTERGGRLDLRR